MTVADQLYIARLQDAGVEPDEAWADQRAAFRHLGDEDDFRALWEYVREHRR